MDPSIHVLHVEDDPLDRDRVREVLAHAGNFSVVDATRLREFELLLAEEEWDCVLTDLQLSGYTGLDVLDRVRATHPSVPVVFLTGSGSEEYAVEAMKRGAADYILKTPPHYAKLPFVLRKAVETQRARQGTLRAERALEQSEAAYRQLFEANPHPMWILDAGTAAFLEVNASARQHYGWTREEFLQMRLPDIEAPIETARRGWGGQGEVQLAALPGRRHRRKDGTVIYVDVSTNPLSWNGRRAEVMLVHDVTDRVSIEEEIQEAFGEISTVYQAAPIGIALVSDGMVLRTNPAFSEITGYAREQLMGLAVDELFASPEDARRFWDVADPQLVSVGRYTCQRQLWRGDRTARWVRLTVQAIDREAPRAGAIWVAEDVEEVQRAELALRKLAEDLAEAQRLGHLGSWSIDAANGRLTWSAEQCRLMGFDAGSAPPTFEDFLTHIHEADRAIVIEARDRMRQRGEPIDIEFRVRPPGGGERWINGLGRAERGPDGRVVRIYGTDHDITAGKLAQEKLRRSRDYYLTVFEDLPTPIWRSGLDAKCDYFNRTWLAFTGRTMEQELGDGWVEGVHPEDRDRCMAAYLDHFNRREPFEIEYRLRHASGGYRLIRDLGRPFDDLDGHFAGFVGACFDLTERVHAEQALRDSELRFRALVDEAADSLFIHDLDGNILDCNEGACDRLGYTRGELLAMTVADVDPVAAGIGHEELRRLFASVLGRKLVIEGRHRCKDGNEFPVEVRIAGVKLDDRIYVIALARDMTERKRAEGMLQEASERWEMAAESAGIGLYDLDIASGTLQFDDRLLKMFGWRRDEFSGRLEQWTQAVHPEDWPRVSSNFEDSLREELPHRGAEYRIVRPDGAVRWIVAYRKVFRDATGQPLRLIGVCEDVTDRKNMELALRESETRFRALIETTTDFIAILNPEGLIKYVSPSVKQVMGYEPEEVLGRSNFEFVHLDDVDRAQETLVGLVARPGGTASLELRLRSSDGSYRRLDVLGRNLLDMPLLHGIVITARDLTGRVVP
jgi:PAS domain S-box-containing protein